MTPCLAVVIGVGAFALGLLVTAGSRRRRHGGFDFEPLPELPMPPRLPRRWPPAPRPEFHDGEAEGWIGGAPLDQS